MAQNRGNRRLAILQPFSGYCLYFSLDDMPRTQAELDEEYQRCHYSVTCHTEDEAVVHCLRALCHFAEIAVKPQIAWGGTKRQDWIAAGHQITLRFTSPHHRDRFIREATRLLPAGCWSETGRSENDPARRQR